VYIDPGDVILVERPTYLAALQVFQSRGANIVSVQSDDHGMDLDDLEAKIRLHHPKLVYVIPTFSNPTGSSWSLEKRQGLLKLCRNHEVLVLEDDPYGELKFAEDAYYPTLYTLDQAAGGGTVVYTGTFSKIVAPALRTGWTVGNEEIIRGMTRAKQAADLHSSTMDQQALYQLLQHFDLDSHIAMICREYEKRMRQMTSLLAQHRWPGVRWNEPKGGMFLWVELPEGMHSKELLTKAVEQGVAFVPGESFYAGDAPLNTLRMNFTYADSEQMELGMARLAKAIHAMNN
jgi:2-aminoadipate transaminase